MQQRRGDPTARERQTLEEVECGLGVPQRHEAIRVCKRLGRSIWKKWSVYHRRSLVGKKCTALLQAAG